MSKTDEAVSSLTEMIRSGRFRVGDRVPTEPELTAELGMSRTAVREAVRALTFAGVLRVRQGDGTYVTSLEPAQLLRSVGVALDLSSVETLAELYAIRRILEPEATAMAAVRMTASDLHDLRGHLAAMADARSAEEFVTADAEFHDVIAGAAGNEALRALLVSLRSESARMRIRRAREEDDAAERTLAEHAAILDALANRDVGRAKASAMQHLAEGERWLRVAAEREHRGPLSRKAP